MRWEQSAALVLAGLAPLASGNPIPVGDAACPETQPTDGSSSNGVNNGVLANPPEGTVRVFYVHPTNVPLDQRYPNGIASVMAEAAAYYKRQFGKTFTVNPVEVVAGSHDKAWYTTNNCDGDNRYWCVVNNMQAEIRERFSIENSDPRWMTVSEISAEEPGKSGGGGGPGYVILSGHDADGAAGGTDMNRWYGGMVHELGHAFGLPDSSGTDSTPMSADFYNYPNTQFSQAQKDAILSGPYAKFLK